MSFVKNNSKISQGEIYWANLNPVKGHEQSGYRPVLVLQNNILNRNLNTVVIAPITKNLQAKGLLTTFYIAKKYSGLNFDSIALLYQLRTIDRKRIGNKVGVLTGEEMRDVKNQLLAVF